MDDTIGICTQPALDRSIEHLPKSWRIDFFMYPLTQYLVDDNLNFSVTTDKRRLTNDSQKLSKDCSNPKLAHRKLDKAG